MGILVVMYRVIQQAVCQVLTPVFDPYCSESSFGFRPNRSAHQAVQKVLKLIQEGYTYAVEFDHWIRRRVRMCYLKQWRKCKKRIGELIKLGAPRYHAILTGLSRKGYLHPESGL